MTVAIRHQILDSCFIYLYSSGESKYIHNVEELLDVIKPVLHERQRGKEKQHMDLMNLVLCLTFRPTGWL